MTEAKIIFNLRNSFSNFPKARIGMIVRKRIKMERIFVVKLIL